MKNSLSRCLVVLLAATIAVTACGSDTGADPASSDDAGTSDVDAGIQDADAGLAQGSDGGSGGPTARTGLEGYCDRYKECGGTYYDTAQECIDTSVDYWGECRRAELDAFGDCMKAIPCDDYNPDMYNPADTDCAEEWSALRAADCD